MSQPERVGYQGLSKVAHAIRRSTALYVATMLLPEGTSDQELFAKADSLAAWIRGAAQPQEARKEDEFLGVDPWSPQE